MLFCQYGGGATRSQRIATKATMVPSTQESDMINKSPLNGKNGRGSKKSPKRCPAATAGEKSNDDRTLLNLLQRCTRGIVATAHTGRSRTDGAPSRGHCARQGSLLLPGRRKPRTAMVRGFVPARKASRVAKGGRPLISHHDSGPRRRLGIKAGQPLGRGGGNHSPIPPKTASPADRTIEKQTTCPSTAHSLQGSGRAGRRPARRVAGIALAYRRTIACTQPQGEHPCR
jgi:hypothetical protein